MKLYTSQGRITIEYKAYKYIMCTPYVYTIENYLGISTYLIKRRQTWYAYVTVPPSLQAIVGKQKLQRSLQTRDLAKANRLKLAVVSEFKNYLDTVRKSVDAGTPLAQVTAAARVLADSVKLGTTSRDNAEDEWSRCNGLHFKQAGLAFIADFGSN